MRRTLRGYPLVSFEMPTGPQRVTKRHNTVPWVTSVRNESVSSWQWLRMERSVRGSYYEPFKY
nr:MAG TPA: hypothetical protein [Caudoviricetes sp.]